MSTSVVPPKRLLNPYQPLPLLTTKNQRVKFISAHPYTPQYVEKHLSKSANLNPKALYDARVKGRSLLLENPAKESRAAKLAREKNARKDKEKARKKLKIIGRKEAKCKGLWDLEEDQRKYELFVPLHHLWLGYMAELLGLRTVPNPLLSDPAMPDSASMHGKLVKADFHGSFMRVKEAKNPCLVGLSGIVIHETENAFKVITEKSKLKLIPKQGSVFAFRIPLYDVRSIAPEQGTTGSSDVSGHPVDLQSLPQMEFQLYGNQFRFRSADRAGRKFKAKETIEL